MGCDERDTRFMYVCMIYSIVNFNPIHNLDLHIRGVRRGLHTILSQRDLHILYNFDNFLYLRFQNKCRRHLLKNSEKERCQNTKQNLRQCVKFETRKCRVFQFNLFSYFNLI